MAAVVVAARGPLRARSLLITLPIVAAALCCLPVGAPAAVHAPFELSQGLVLGAGVPTPYTMAVRSALLVGTGRLDRCRAGPIASLNYHDPAWVLSGGLRADVRVVSLLRDAGLVASGEITWGERYTRPALGCHLALSEYVQVGMRAGYETHRKKTDLQAYVSTDLPTLFTTLFGTQQALPEQPE